MIINKKIVPQKLIRQAIYAWTIICKQFSISNLPLDAYILNKALMLLNLTMSEKVIRSWLRKVKD